MSVHNCRIVRPLAFPLRGNFSVPGDKSLSHRALMLASMAQGVSHIQRLLDSWDVHSTYNILKKLGARFCGTWENLSVQGWGSARAVGPLNLDCGNSGTTMRLMAGILAAGAGEYVLYGDDSLKNRPMLRIYEPLKVMGANISTSPTGTSPLHIKSTSLTSSVCELKIASAQVKSCILLAGVQSCGKTAIVGSIDSRDHTERMLRSLGVKLHRQGNEIHLEGPQTWRGFTINIPGDPSAASFPVALACLIPNSHIKIIDVNLNPTRLGFFDILRRMGAKLNIEVKAEELGEPRGNIDIKYGELHGTTVYGDEIAMCIDELPLLAIVAAHARGITEVRGAEELRHKESDRIANTVGELRKLGVNIAEYCDGFAVKGPTSWRSAIVKTHGDHRLEMGLAIAGWGSPASQKIIIEDTGWNSVSWPKFWETFC